MLCFESAAHLYALPDLQCNCQVEYLTVALAVHVLDMRLVALPDHRYTLSAYLLAAFSSSGSPLADC